MEIRKKVIICDAIAEAAVDILKKSLEVDVRLGLSSADLSRAVVEYNALIVRSQTKVTSQIIDAGKNLELIARAGVGVDNIDVEAATRSGILVINAPEGNTVSTAEHTIAMLLSMVRQIPKANGKLLGGVWDRSLRGIEIRNKVLGVIGFGRVGSAVAELAKGLRMNVVVYDPMVSQGAADRLGVTSVDMETLLAKSDFVTVHVPLTSTTTGLIGREQIRLMKPSAMVVNCARGGIIDEQALYEALEEGRLSGAAVDVFTTEPAIGNILLKSNKVVVTPHLAASTHEAEAGSGIDIAQQTIAVLGGHPPKSPVNAPLLSVEGMELIRQYIPAATMLGNVAAQLFAGQARSISIVYQGEISKLNTDPIKAAVLGGLLERLTDERVNMVNMDFIASSRGLRITEERDSVCEHYSSLITLGVQGAAGRTTVAASALRGRDYLTRFDDFWMEIEPVGGYMVFTEHRDRPGMIGAVGSILGNAGVNISQMQVSRDLERGGKAMMVLCLDDPLRTEVHQQLLRIPDMHKLHIVKLAK